MLIHPVNIKMFDEEVGHRELMFLFGEDRMPPKVRELIAELERAGFVNRGGMGSHKSFVHPKVSKPIPIAGKPSDDAKEYQVRVVRSAVEEPRR
jgi:predicted RNA binding protein YcfA (HicA-like mRNA interferase family)